MCFVGPREETGDQRTEINTMLEDKRDPEMSSASRSQKLTNRGLEGASPSCSVWTSHVWHKLQIMAGSWKYQKSLFQVFEAQSL